MSNFLWALAADPDTFSIYLKITYNVLLVIIGINALIIVHEFGHFAVARACGVRCDKFYIWFDFWGLRFFKFKWGDTEYGLGVFPLGGYVKMLGQEDNPSELKGKGIGDTGENASEADAANVIPPDSFLAKSVPQRMAIIVAGVVMNFLFAIVCGAGAFMVGITDTAPMVGNVIPGSPAWQADMRAGDKITAINGQPARAFVDLNMSMIGSENGLKLSIDRPGVGEIEKTIVPRKRKNDLAPSIGISPLPTLNLASEKQATQDYATDWYDPKTLDALKKTDMKLIEVDGTPVADFPQFMRAQLKKNGLPIACVFVSEKAPDQKISVEVPAIPMRELGIRFQMGPITMVRPDSDAFKQGVEPGDIIQSVDGVTDIDPMKLSQIVLRKQNEGKTSVDLAVKKKDGSDKTLTVGLAAETIIPHCAGLSMKDPLGSTALGIAWEMLPVIAGIEEGGPTTIGLPIGATVESFELLNSVALLNGTTFCEEVADGFKFISIGDRVDLPYLLEFWLQYAVQKPLKGEEGKKPTEDAPFRPIEKVRLTLSGKGVDGKKTFDVPVIVSKDWFDLDRGFAFNIETLTFKTNNLGEALSLGTNKMIEYSLSVFKFLKRLGGEVSPRALGGPVTIVKAAYMFVEKGFGSYLLFLCLIGANLAVLNILPIPVLDGGHLLFLAYEGIFRKPPNENVLIILSYLGLALLLLLMIWAFSLDLGFVKRL